MVFAGAESNGNRGQDRKPKVLQRPPSFGRDAVSAWGGVLSAPDRFGDMLTGDFPACLPRGRQICDEETVVVFNEEFFHPNL